MAGLKVVPVKTHVDGNLDLADLKEKAEKYTDNLAAFMVGIYPSSQASLNSCRLRILQRSVSSKMELWKLVKLFMIVAAKFIWMARISTPKLA